MWESLPYPLLLRVLSHLSVKDICSCGRVCRTWSQAAFDDLLWREKFQQDWKVDHSIPPLNGALWRNEYSRLSYEAPVLETEVLREHTHQVLHVSFSHNGHYFSSCSKDGHVKLWNAHFPATVRHSRNMRDLSWNYTQFSQFNESDTLLLVSGVHFGAHTASGEIAVFNLRDGFALQCRVLNKPYDIFGTWYADHYLLSGKLHFLGQLLSCSAVWLNKAWQESESEKKPIIKPLFKFFNKNASSVRTILVANCEPPRTRGNPVSDPWASQDDDDTDEDSADSDDPLDPREKLLIFTTGSLTYAPHQVGFKRIRPFRFAEPEKEPVSLTQRLAEYQERQSRDPPDPMNQKFDTVDELIDLHGHIIGMGLSPDHRYLYINSRPWPQNYVIEEPLQPPPIAQEIDIHVVDLKTLKEIGNLLRSHKAYTPNDECFFIFLDVSDMYVASGAEDKQGHLWDRHYAICLAKLPHDDVVNAVAFNPMDDQMLVTASDDYTLKVWRSRNRAQELGLT
ncbi:F-box/WD repeat-containing protein 5-like [Ornithodoros turicata]|uniref:Putative conserved secreted protein n=1 Tax=Ornithodoros turicata TaxID=34597 RepID=A0A2R5LMX6_9ACAR